ncbi:MAG: DUF4097 family beta strand repeat-containing protein [Rhodothermales bacterium]|nr:DUF4097 family beta strand repeat-containing protein [Rhodothermales bacterium]
MRRSLLLLLPFALLVGCGGEDDVARTEEGLLRLGREEARAVTERTVRLDGRTLVLSADAGSVTVVGDPAAVEARLQFERVARGATEASAAERLERLTIEEAGDGEIYQYVVESAEVEGARVHVEAVVPANTPLVVQLDRGAVRLSGVTGELQVENENGDVELAGVAGERVRVTTRRGAIAAGFGTLPAGADIRLETENGDLGLTLPATVDAAVRVTTDAGDIAVQGLAFANRDLDETDAGMRFSGRLGRGSARIVAETGVGDVLLQQGEQLELEGVEPFDEEVEAARPSPGAAGVGAEEDAL